MEGFVPPDVSSFLVEDFLSVVGWYLWQRQAVLSQVRQWLHANQSPGRALKRTSICSSRSRRARCATRGGPTYWATRSPEGIRSPGERAVVSSHILSTSPRLRAMCRKESRSATDPSSRNPGPTTRVCLMRGALVGGGGARIVGENERFTLIEEGDLTSGELADELTAGESQQEL